MGFFRPRFTIRWMLVAVALAAVCLWAVDRRWRFLKLASFHQARQIIAWDGRNPYSFPGAMLRMGDFTEFNPRWHHMMEQKYLRAARYPWLPVPSGPLPEAFIREDCVAYRMRSFSESESQAREACCRPPGPKPPPSPIPTDKPPDRDFGDAARDPVESRLESSGSPPPEPR